jgi:hypothetical protein
VPQVPTTDEWKQWVDTDYTCSIPVKDRETQIHTFPVYWPPDDKWMVFKPFSDDYMIVPGTAYEEHRLERSRVKFASEVPVSGLQPRHGQDA